MRNGRCPDPLAVIGRHQAGESLSDPFGRPESHVFGNFQFLHYDLGLGHAPETHGRVPPSRPQPRVFAANRDEPADALSFTAFDQLCEYQVNPGDAAPGNPVLGSVQDIPVCLLHSGCRHLCCGTSGSRFGDTDCRLVTRKDKRRAAPLLPVRAIGHDRTDCAQVGLDDDAPGYGAAMGHLFNDEHRIHAVPTLAAIFGRNRHAHETGIRQELDVVPRIFLGAVDLCRPRAEFVLCEKPGRFLQPELLIGQPVQVALPNGSPGRQNG